MSELIKRFEGCICRDHLLAPNQSLLIAVSGGVDSMVLFDLFRSLSKQYGWRLTVGHLNHRLRGRSSDADERLVRSVARRFRVPCVVEGANVRSFAKTRKVSVEMAARELRHTFLSKVASDRGIKTIALAHHADDQVELFLLRLLRGSGSQGLGGMKASSPSPVSRGLTCIRPLLEFSKSELLEFARCEKVLFREDASNVSSDFLRNRIRSELLPLLRKSYQPALNAVILRNMEILRAEAAFLDDLTNQWEQKPSDLDQAPIAIQRLILQRRLIAQGLAPEFRMVEKLRTHPNLRQSLHSGLALKSDGQGRLIRVHREATSYKSGTLMLELEGEHRRGSFGGLEWKWEARNRRKARNPVFGPACEWFDADKVGTSATLRHWKAGDRFQPIGAKRPVKLQDLFTNLKVLRAERHSRVVAATASGEIWWVEGLRIAENFKLTPETKRMLKWNWKRVSTE